MVENYKDYQINYGIWSFEYQKCYFIANWEVPMAKGITFNERVCYPISSNNDEEIKRCLSETKKEIIRREKKWDAKIANT